MALPDHAIASAKVRRSVVKGRWGLFSGKTPSEMSNLQKITALSRGMT